jgi:hypothetical protein
MRRPWRERSSRRRTARTTRFATALGWPLYACCVSREPYRQLLPELGLSIERLTDNVPADGAWYMLRAGETVGRFRSLKAAQAAWREALRAADWKPKPRELDVGDVQRREQIERWSRNRAG